MAPSVERLRTTSQFERVRREGRSWSTRPMILNAAKNGTTVIRCGFITGKKVGNAVERNRARRRIREAVRLRLPLITPGWDLVWIARSAITAEEYGAVAQAVDETLRRAGIITPRVSATVGEQSRIIEGGAAGPPTAEGPGREP